MGIYQIWDYEAYSRFISSIYGLNTFLNLRIPMYPRNLDVKCPCRFFYIIRAMWLHCYNFFPDKYRPGICVLHFHHPLVSRSEVGGGSRVKNEKKKKKKKKFKTSNFPM